MTPEVQVGIAGVIAALIAAVVPYWLARKTGQLRKPQFSVRLGYVMARGYTGPPIRHTLFWIPENSIAGYGSIPYLIENPSGVTIAGLRLQIIVESRLALSNEAFKELSTGVGGEYFDHPFFKTRRVQYSPDYAAIEYDIGALNPGTAHMACEPIRFTRAAVEEPMSYGTGFDQIVSQIRALPRVLYFTTARVTCSAENLPTKGARANICIMAQPAELRRAIRFDGSADLTTGIQRQNVQGAAGTLAHAIGVEVWKYARCFWLGGKSPETLALRFLPLTRKEGLEVVQFALPVEDGQDSLRLELPQTIITQPIQVPRRSYYSLPPNITDADQVLRHNGAIVLRSKLGIGLAWAVLIGLWLAFSVGAWWLFK